MFEAELGLYWKLRPGSGPVFIHSSLFPWLPGGQPVLHEAQSAHPSQPVTEGLPQRPEGHDPSHVLYPQMFARTKYTDHFSICLSSPLSFENNISYWESLTQSQSHEWNRWICFRHRLFSSSDLSQGCLPNIKYHLICIKINIIKILWSHDHPVFIMGNLVTGKPSLYGNSRLFLEVSDLEWYRMNCGMTPVKFQRFLILIDIWKNQYHISNCIISILTRTVWICYILYHGKTSSYFLNWVVKGMIPKANCLPSKLLSHFRSRFND